METSETSVAAEVDTNVVPVTVEDGSETRAAAAAAAGDSHSATGRGSTITFHNIHYSVQVKDQEKCCGRPQLTKTILTDVSGIFKPGMNAILGPSGSGKSSLLDVLAGRKDPAGLSGQVLIDGYKQPANFKCMSGYVVQDDMVLGTLTVRENFTFSANMRLPATVSKQEKQEKVESTIRELCLEACADTKVGTELIRGVSGGERKRTNIGIELIISPSVLFLDEPTTGLDAYTANSTMQLLHKLSRGGRTVIFSIHQPRFAIFRLFDNLVLLGRGRTLYHGPALEALDFFQSMGYECEPFNNPPDFFLDVMQGDYESKKSDVGEQAEDEPPGSLSMSEDDVVVEISGAGAKASGRHKQLHEQLSDSYYQSRWFTNVKDEIDPIYKEYEANKSACMEEPAYATSFWRQMFYLSKRFVVNLFRNFQLSVMQWGMMTVFALIVGIIYFDVDNSDPNGIQNRSGALFFITMNVVLPNINALEVFIKERALFIHENISGFYRVSSYFVGKVLCDLLPMRAMPLIPYTIISYFMIGFDPVVGKFFFYFLHIFLTSFAATALAFLVSSIVGVLSVGIVFMAGVFIVMMVFGGMFFNVTDIAVWLRWLQYLSLFRYSMKALCINEMKDMEFCKTQNGTESCSLAGNAYLENQDINYGTAWDLWQNEVALFVLSLVFLFLAYVRLLRVKKLK